MQCVLEIELAGHQNVTDDRAVDVRQVTQARDIVQRAHRAARINRNRDIVAELFGQRQGFLEIRFQARDILVDNARDTGHLQVANQVLRHKRRLRPPAVDHDIAVAGREVHDDTAGMAACRLDHQRRIGDRDGSQHHPRRAGLEPVVDLHQRSDAAGYLDRNIGIVNDIPDQGFIVCILRPGRIDVDDLQHLRALVDKVTCHFTRVDLMDDVVTFIRGTGYYLAAL